MQFFEDEEREEYHNLPTLLQIVCGVFESMCLSYSKEPELLEVKNESTVMLGVPRLKKSEVKSIEDEMNKQFPRKGFKHKTCECTDPAYGIFQIYVTSASDFKNLH